MREIAEVETLVKGGAMVELLPSPITGPQTQAYQAFSGRSPASSGFFDTLVPHDYSVKEEVAGPGPSPKLLPDLLRTVGWTVRYQEVRLSELVVCLQSWTQTASASPAGLIVKCVVETGFDASALAQALQLARAWIGESGLLALFS